LIQRIATVAERPDLVEPGWERTRDVLPEYNNHGDVLNVYWPRLTEERPDFQFHLVGDGDEILARARSLPVRWDGSVADLPAGIDGAIARGFDERDADGLLFDPWMRVHERLGATILKAEPHSLRITGTLAEWEEWTGVRFPESGEYWFPHGLATLAIDHEQDIGGYWEPNVWMRHAPAADSLSRGSRK
jgi:hypothetical protein